MSISLACGAKGLQKSVSIYYKISNILTYLWSPLAPLIMLIIFNKFFGMFIILFNNWTNWGQAHNRYFLRGGRYSLRSQRIPQFLNNIKKIFSLFRSYFHYPMKCLRILLAFNLILQFCNSNFPKIKTIGQNLNEKKFKLQNNL